MGVGGGEAAPLGAHMHGDSLEAQIVEAHQPGLGAHPYFAADILRRRRVVSLIVGEVTVAMHGALRLYETGEQGRGQRPELRLFGLGEKRADLLADRAMDPGVGDGALPLGQERVLGGETGELPALQSVRLGKLYARLDLPLVTRHRGLGW